MSDTDLLLKAGDIAAAYVSRNKIERQELPGLVEEIYTTLQRISSEGVNPRPTPAVPIEDSVHFDKLICLEDGAEVTLLTRYLRRHFGMSPEEYREKWGLPEDYPMVTEKYSKTRSAIAKDQGLGKS